MTIKKTVSITLTDEEKQTIRATKEMLDKIYTSKGVSDETLSKLYDAECILTAILNGKL